MCMNEMNIITGGNDQEYRNLLNHPEQFDSDTYIALCERYRHRLSLDVLIALSARRLRRRRYGNELDRKALLAVLDGRYDEAKRLGAIQKRRNDLGFRVADPGPASLPGSDEEDT